MRLLGTWSRAGLDGVRLMIGLYDLRGLFQTKLFYDSILIQGSEDEAFSWFCPVSYPFRMQLHKEVEAPFSQDRWFEDSFEHPRKSFMPLTAEE